MDLTLCLRWRTKFTDWKCQVRQNNLWSLKGIGLRIKLCQNVDKRSLCLEGILKSTILSTFVICI